LGSRILGRDRSDFDRFIDVIGRKSGSRPIGWADSAG
jgi:hypothetical protein